jgi:hypothetical protein
MKRPKEAARSLRQAAPARAGRDGTAACRRDLAQRHGRTGKVWFFLSRVCDFNFLNPRFIRTNSIITKQNPTTPSIQRKVGSQHQQHSGLEQNHAWRAYLTVSPVAASRELLQWWCVASLPVPGQSLRPGATKLCAAKSLQAWKRKAAERARDTRIKQFHCRKKNPRLTTLG